MINDLTQELNEIYDTYKSKVEEASSMWKSEYCYSQKEEDKRNIEDKEDLKYFKELLQNIKRRSDKDYKEIILFLLDELEEHHSGMKNIYLHDIENKYNIDF